MVSRISCKFPAVLPVSAVLTSCGVGDRLLRSINNFIEKEGLQDIVASKPLAKKAKIDAKSERAGALITPQESSFDEFDDGLDLSSIHIP